MSNLQFITFCFMGASILFLGLYSVNTNKENDEIIIKFIFSFILLFIATYLFDYYMPNRLY